jgi:glyoxylase-like metal-dependent hydrolase (beta-lactamase superfamily II)
MADFGSLDFPELFNNEEIFIYQPCEDLYLLQTRKDIDASIYVLVGSSRALVIDSGMTVSNLLEMVRKVTDKPVDLALTHGHRDHIGSVHEFEQVFMHRGDRAMIANYQGTVSEVRNGFVFDLGGLTAEVVELPGHTEGSIGFLDSKKRFFVGDAIGSKRCLMQFTKLPLEALLETIRRIERLAERWEGIWTGHFRRMNKVLGMDYVQQIKDLVESLVKGDGRFQGKADPESQVEWKIDFVPWKAENGELYLIYNPRRVHYV